MFEQFRKPIDATDQAIRAERLAQRDMIEGPRIGDFVVFNGG